MAKIAAFGEILLRLKTPGNSRLFQEPSLEATFGGAEANTAASLAQFGHEVSFVTLLPDNDIGDASLRFLRQFGVDTSGIVRKPGRLGLYFLEAGANQRASNVIYDRAHSVLSGCQPGDIDWTDALEGVDILHFSGITPAVSQQAADMTLTALKTAKSLGVRISCDLNFRAKLWTYGKAAPEVMTALFEYVDIGIAGREDLQQSLGIEPPRPLEVDGELSLDACRALMELALERFPNLEMLAMTLRQGRSAQHTLWSACLATRSDFHVSRSHEIENVVDRIGAGDSFAAGLLHGLSELDGHLPALEFAVAASCLKHSIPGDVNLATVDEVEALLKGGDGARVQR